MRLTGYGLLLSGVAGLALMPRAQAQTAQAVAMPAYHHFNIPAGRLDEGLNAWARATGRSIVFRSKDVAAIRTAGVKGLMSDDAALTALLAGTPYDYLAEEGGVVAVVPRQIDTRATPDILVIGKRESWSLNTGIERTQDDSQPFIVMTGEEIKRSGAPNLETFLRDRLNVDSSPGVSEQAKPYQSTPSRGRGTSSINLRGVGTRDTLILVDGRRQPGVNFGNGEINQASITGIPISAIERIEVLASSASGIYGSGASGGVINIVLKRDFKGGEISASYGNTTDFAQGQKQIDLTYGMPIEGGRTRLAFSGSWSKSQPLLYGDRSDLAMRSIAEITARDPQGLGDIFLAPPAGTTVNFKSIQSGPLQLKPAYGGATLNSSFGHVPFNYRGLAVDGLAPLLAGLGSYNYQPPDSSVSLGRRAPLLYGSEHWTASLSARRVFNDWLTGYIGGTFARSSSVDARSQGPTTVFLRAAAPNNPFTGDLWITLPGVGREAVVRNQQTSATLVGGAIIKLPADWQAALDMSYARTTFNGDRSPASVSTATQTSLVSGAQDVLRDFAGNPLNIVYDDAPFSFAASPGRASTFNPSLRMAGPLPVTLPGGKARMTLNLEYDDERLGGVVTASQLSTISAVILTPASRQRTWSVYSELAVPLVGPDNRVPLIRELELRVSARAERYRGDGATPYFCHIYFGFLPAGDPFANCPPAGAAIKTAVTRSSHVDPSISVRWSPAKPLTLRASYTTGYLPPMLSQLVRRPIDRLQIPVTDPMRGGEPIPLLLTSGSSPAAYLGGNPNVRPETSRTFSVGAIITPAFLPGLRFSADWTHIRKHDLYFNPQLLTDGFSQAGFNEFLNNNPDRATRGAPSNGFAVGPITSLDLSLVNLNSLSTNAVDFVLDYNHDLFGGNLSITSRATYVDSLVVISFPGRPGQDYAGVVSRDFATVSASNGSLRWRGSFDASWSKGILTVGWQARYFGPYALNVAHSVVPTQGSAYVSSQLYHDFNVSLRFKNGITVRASLDNAFNKKPPLDASAAPLFYSAYGDPRLRNFFVGVSKSF